MWNAEQLDTLTEVVAQRLLVEGDSARAVAADLADQITATNPDLPALALALPFTLAAGGMEDMLGAGEEACTAAHRAWRIAALIGAEVLAMEAVNGTFPSVAQLRDHWASDAPCF